MPAEGNPNEPGVAPVIPITSVRDRAAAATAPAHPPRPGLGIAAFAIAALFAIVPDLSIAIVPDLTADDMSGITGIMSLASLLPFIMGIVAVVSRRGRYWGVAAITLSLLSNYLVFALVSVMHFYLGDGSLALGI